mgnify:FL=1|jgi:hypothetical protein
MHSIDRGRGSERRLSETLVPFFSSMAVVFALLVLCLAFLLSVFWGERTRRVRAVMWLHETSMSGFRSAMFAPTDVIIPNVSIVHAGEAFFQVAFILFLSCAGMGGTCTPVPHPRIVFFEELFARCVLPLLRPRSPTVSPIVSPTVSPTVLVKAMVTTWVCFARFTPAKVRHRRAASRSELPTRSRGGVSELPTPRK